MALVCNPAARAESERDTLKNVDVEEAVVVASPKETSRLRQQPLSASIFSENDLRSRGAASLKGVSDFAPNFYMPDYGSRLTSAVYIRGIGSRMNTPAVGLYVDNIPYIDKSAYDFAFADVERVDVLRGAQGTLYGRNSMGGLVRVFTANPLTHYGTDVEIGASTRNGGRKLKATTYLHPSEKIAFSVGGFYDGQNGFFRNITLGKSADASDAGGGKIRMAWRPAADWTVDLNLSYEYSDEQACPYYLKTEDEGEEVRNNPFASGYIGQNRQSAYRRNLLNSGLGVEWQRPNMTLSSITSFQFIADRLFMDQDFTSADIFSLEQTQNMRAITEELSLKSRPGRRWQWTSGLFFMYEGMKTTCPVNFYGDGVDYLNSIFASVLPTTMPMTLQLTGSDLPFNARFRTPVYNAALFHQSSIDLGAGLSVVAGLRLDYDHRKLELASGTTKPVEYKFGMSMLPAPYEGKVEPVLNGTCNDDSWQLLPKLALQYNHRSGRGNVYVAVSKGYRSGGYNIQSYSDLSQALLQRTMMQDIRDFSIHTINSMPLPEAAKNAAIAGMTGAMDSHIPEVPSVASLSYRPEQSWNYEMGGHLTFCDRKLQLEYTLFYMNTRDQQLARFSNSGMGRVMVNAGKTRSLGAEISARALLLNDRLTFSAAYGYTDARLRKYDLGLDKTETRVDYSGNRVPFAPEHTLGAQVSFRQPLSGCFVRSVTAHINVDAAGRFYWDEANSFSQPFYARLGARLAAELPGNVSFEVWGKNLTGTEYDTFAFESFSRRFAQRGTPRYFGIDILWHF